jgi:hypothetical protein
MEQVKKVELREESFASATRDCRGEGRVWSLMEGQLSVERVNRNERGTLRDEGILPSV